MPGPIMYPLNLFKVSYKGHKDELSSEKIHIFNFNSAKCKYISFLDNTEVKFKIIFTSACFALLQKLCVNID